MEENATTQMPSNQPVQVPVLAVQSAATYEAQKKAEADAKAAQLAGDQVKTSLLSYLERCRSEATYAKQNSGVTDKLLEAQRRRNNTHSPEKIAQLKKYNLPNYWVPLTQTKCIHTEAWLRDLLMPYADKIWKLFPTEIPELQSDEREEILSGLMEEAKQFILQGGMVSDEQIHKVREELEAKYKKAMMEEAKDKAANMERLIQDQHEECEFKASFKEFQANLTTYGTAFIKGPVTISKKSPKWDGEKRIVVDKIIPSCSAPSPHDIYPAPWAKNEKEGYILERIKTYRDGLSSVRKLEYYQTKEIEDFLSENQAGVARTYQYGDETRNPAENKTLTPPDNRLEIWQYSGPIPGYMLTDWGLTDCEASQDYNVEVLWGGTHILKVMPTWDEVGVKPYFRAVFKDVPGSFWGVGVPLLMSASQDRANAMMIQLLDNTTWGTGFIGWIDQTRVVNVDDIKEMYAKKWIPTFSKPGDSGAPMGMIQPDLHVGELDALYQKCLVDADNESGVPAYMYGSGGGSAAIGTYSGLQTLMNASARGIKDCLLAIDDAIARFINHWADWNMTYEEDESVKGDIRVVCTGATGLFVVEMEIDKLDNLIAQATPFMPLTGPGFILGMLRQKAKHLKADTSMLPTDDEIKAKMEAGANSPENQTKSSLSISVKWETLTDAEKAIFAGLVPELSHGEKNKEQAPPPPEGAAMPTTTTGTPPTMPGPDVAPGQQMESNGNVKPLPPVNK